MFLIVLLMVVNGLISWWNCYVCGSTWVEAKYLGGWPRLLVWCGAIQACVGFSMVFIALIGGLASATHYLPPKAVEAMFQLWYLLVIIPALGTGLAITVHSWIAAYRERDLLSMGVATWNTMAQAHNMYEAVGGIGSAFDGVSDFFKGGDDDDGIQTRLVIVVFLLVAIALLSSVLLTATLIKHYAATRPLPVRQTA